MSDYRRRVGKSGEDEASAFLQKTGYSILEKNFRAERGEIDIIARDGDVVVFVEVKTGRGSGFGPPEMWVDKRKQAQIGKVAQSFLLEQGWTDVDCRFDVVAVDRSGENTEIRHVRDAFWLERS